MSPQFIIQQFENDACTITLNRPEKRNAFNPTMMQELIDAIELANNKKNLHYILVKANGPCFSAGADLTHMKTMSDVSYDENKEDAALLARLLKTYFDCPHPLVMFCHGSATGGALGLLACADYVIAESTCQFRLSEVSLGITPATIAPYLNQSMGTSWLLAYALSASTIDAEQAYQAGLVHELMDQKPESEHDTMTQFLANSPSAMRSFKEQCRSLNPITDDTIQHSIACLANVRSSDDAREGLAAFMEKRSPTWKKEV